MDPNNMNAAGMPNTPNQPVDSAQPVGPQTVEQALAEANMEVASKAGVPMGAPVKKSGKGMVYGMIIFMILAIGGIGFGVWAMMDGNMQKANLEKQISDLRAQNNQLQEQIAEGGGGNNGGETSAVDPEDYIYVGEWGLKIKIPEGLSVNDYKFGTGDGFTSISIGLNIDAYGDSYYLATVTRAVSIDDDAPYEPAFSADDYYYIVSHANGDLAESLQAELDLILSMLSDQSNYSAI